MSQSLSAPPPPAAPDPAPAAPASDVLVTICSSGDGSYTVYSGDEPDDAGGADMSADDAGAMGADGDAPGAQGQPADSIGAALKAAMTILQAAASSAGGAGTADDQMAAGFGASQSPTPAGSPMAQKY